jgi:hypothetical protein
MEISCSVCRADPAGRWKNPPAMVFRDRHQPGDAGPPKYFCRDHVSEKRNAQLAAIEKVKGGALR